ncbi:hypothetical protein JCM5353_005836 [Sporobolomyces roseus]
MNYVVPDPEYCLTSFKLPNFVVWIKVDGKPVHIYARSGQQENVTGYIEGEEGKRYEVYYVDLRTAAPSHSYSTILHVNGTEVEGTAVEKEDEGFKYDFDNPWRFQEYSAVKVNHRSTGRPLTFEEVTSADQANDSCHPEASSTTGTIRLEYRRAKRIKEVSKGKRAKIAMLGFDYLDQDIKQPFVRFEFRYRSQAFLVSQNHIKLPPILLDNPRLVLSNLKDIDFGKLDEAINGIKEVRRRDQVTAERERNGPVEALANAMSLDFILDSSSDSRFFDYGASSSGESNRNPMQFGLPSVLSAASPPTM